MRFIAGILCAWGEMYLVASLVVLLGAIACGSPEPVGPEPTQPAPTGSVDSLVQQECGRCHATQSPHLQTAADLVRAGAQDEIDSGHMPPDKRLSADVKKRLSDAAGDK